MDGLDTYRKLIAKVDAQCRRSRDLLGARLHCGPGCCDCCRHIAVFAVEAVALAAAFKELGAEQAGAVRRRAAVADSDGACPLLDVGGRCVMYAARPVICRTQGLPLLVREKAALRISACGRNDFSAAPIPAGAAVDLERLNLLLAAVNRLFVARNRPRCPERITIAQALKMEIP